MFHTKNGLFFHRCANGYVNIIKTRDGKEIADGATNIITDVTLAPEAWASVVASMSLLGETSDRYRKALDFHGMEEYTDYS